MFKVLLLNEISDAGIDKLPTRQYQIVSSIEEEPQAIFLRSADLHQVQIPKTVLAIGRAGSGVDNIPVDILSKLGISVFNTPGANANAVKELVVASLIIASRHLVEAWDFARSTEGSDKDIKKAVEESKKRFDGFELSGRTLGVVGLGAVGHLVANAGTALGMKVIGYDSGLTIEGAWQISAAVQRVKSLEGLLRQADFVTFHVPLTNTTQNMLNSTRLGLLKEGVVILNFSRSGIVDDAVVSAAIKSGKVSAYVCDFPTALLKNHERIVTFPHLGASTDEAEESCALMVVEQVRDFLEHGNVHNSVNFPGMVVHRNSEYRLAIANANIPNMLGQISEALGESGINIHDMTNMSRGDLAYTIVDLDSPVPDSVLAKIKGIEGVLIARLVEPPER